MTITDPSAPVSTDVLAGGSDNDPWRPSPRLVRRTVAAVLAAGVTAGTVLLVGDLVLDRRARDAVRLEAYSTALHGEHESVTLLIRSAGEHPVEVESIRLLGEGHGEVASGLRVSPGHAVEIDLLPGESCAADPFARGPREAEVTVRTHRGQLVRRTVSMDEVLAERFERQERARCGVPAIDQSITTRLVRHRATADGAVVTFGFVNMSVVPLTLGDWSGLSGLQAAPPPRPVVLTPAAGPGEQAPEVLVSVPLRMQSCGLWEQSRQEVAALGEAEPGVEVPWGAGVLVAFSLSRQDGEITLHLHDEPVDGLPRELSEDRLLRWLDGRC